MGWYLSTMERVCREPYQERPPSRGYSGGGCKSYRMCSFDTDPSPPTVLSDISLLLDDNWCDDPTNLTPFLSAKR